MKKLKYSYPFLTMVPAATTYSILTQDQIQDSFSVILPTIHVLGGGTLNSFNY